MTLWELLDGHCFILFIGLCCTYWIAVRLLRLPVLMIHGWPPSDATHYCDADGDWKRKENKEESQ